MLMIIFYKLNNSFIIEGACQRVYGIQMPTNIEDQDHVFRGEI